MTNKQTTYFKKLKKPKNCITYYCNNINLGNRGCINFLNQGEIAEYYIIENVEFPNGLYIKANEHTHIMFKNCIFHKNISINSLGEITFENNRYYGDADCPMFPMFFFTCNSKTLRFVYETFTNNGKYLGNEENIFGLNINCDFLTIDDSLINIREENGKININTKETIIFDSILDCPNINLKADDIYIYDSSVIADNSISIENKNVDNSEISGIESSYIYNGEVVEKTKVFKI